jgi:hypothetical protein
MKILLLCGRALLGLAPVLFLQSSSGADVKTYVIEKGIQYFQTSVVAPVADSNNGVSFETVVKTHGTNVVTGVVLQLPTGSTVTIPQDAPDEFKLKQKYNKQSGVDNAFPNGTYHLTLNAVHDGTKQLPLALTGDLYPNVPRLSNFPATQALDAGAYFVFNWDPFTGGGPGDFIQLHIDDSSGNKVWETPDVGEVGQLNGLATSALMPAGTLNPGQTYQANLDYGKAATRDATTYPGALGLAQYYRRTKFAIVTAPVATASAVKLYTVSKIRRYQQVDLGAPTPDTSKPFNIDIALSATAVAAVTSVSVTLPNVTLEQLNLQSDDKSFDFADTSLTQAGLDATYPDGPYAFHIATPAGTKNPVLNLSGDSYPNPPHVTTPSANLNAGADWTVSWESFDGGTSSDFIQLHIDDDQGNKVFETPNFAKSGALDGTATQATVPQNTFNPGKTYTGRVVFQKNLGPDTISYPGALGNASYTSRTSFKVTVAGPPGAPQLTVLSFSATGDFELGIQETPNATVRLDASSDLKAWTPVSTNSVPASGQLTFSDAGVHTQNARYFRAVLIQ